MQITRTWKVYGIHGKHQRESYMPSYRYDFSNREDGIRIIDVRNADKTGTHDYSIVGITRNNAMECEQELEGQLYDGVFENSLFGTVEEVFE